MNTVYIGPVPVEVRFDFEPECLGHGEHPDSPATATIKQFKINGVWVDSGWFEGFSGDAWIDAAEAGIVLQSAGLAQRNRDHSR